MRNTIKQNKQILEVALAYVQSVKYAVGLRWLFYRLLQDGFYNSKKDYRGKMLPLFSKARKGFQYGWKPNTLVDDTRNIIWGGVGHRDKKEWLESLECDLDKIQNQDYVLMIFYEAKAMTGQFEYYTKNIPLVAFGGDASIPYKSEIAKAIEYLAERYNKPIKVLYFGDCDKKGKQIPQSALKDIEKWCKVDFELIPCGLTIEQAEGFDLHSNPEKPNQYQWEALSDEQAKAIIVPCVKKYQDESKIKEIEDEEERILEEVKEVLKQ